MESTLEYYGTSHENPIPVEFTLDELWCMRAYVRHESGQRWDGRYPNTNLAFNRTIAEALLFCEDTKQDRAFIEISKEDCMVIDSVIPQDAKSANGVAIGKSILLKSMRAWLKLEDKYLDATAIGYNPSKETIQRQLNEWKEQEDASTEPNDHPYDQS
jgi:hypothetical protein